MYQGIATEKVGVPIKGHAPSNRAVVWRKTANRLAYEESGVSSSGILPVTLRPTLRGDYFADLWNRMTNVAEGRHARNPITPDSVSAHRWSIAMQKSAFTDTVIYSTERNQSALKQPKRDFWGGSPAGQRARLIDVLAETPVTMLEAQDNLEIPDPQAHVNALRQEGYNIQASFCWVTGLDGGRKCSIRYELQDGTYRPWVGRVSGGGSR